MSPTSRRTGQRYAAGSHVVWGGWETRTCVVCAQRVTLEQSAFHSRTLGSVHVACGGLRALADRKKGRS